MKYKALLFNSLLTLSSLSLWGGVEWKTDYTEVQRQGKEEQKPLLLFFNGSDWSGWAMKLKHEVLDSPRFQEKVGTEFVYLEVDFPQHSTPAAALKQQNRDLMQRFGVGDIPTLLLLTPDERVIAKFGYLPESPEQLAEDLVRMVSQDRQLVQGLAELPKSAVNLRKLYQLAQELRREEAIETILTAGLETKETFFYTEKYRLLVEQGKMRSKEALELRERLLALDPSNQQGSHYTLALIDFQELSQGENPRLAAQPLIDYLRCFGAQDPENVWRMEMMVAQLYLEANAWEEALEHAQKAYQAAPEGMHGEIAHSLEYIRSHTTSGEVAHNIP